MLLHRLGERAEDDALFGQGFPESGRNRYGVKDRIHRHDSREYVALLQRNAQLFEGLGQLRVDLLGPVLVLLGGGVVNDVLEIDPGHVQMGPVRHGHRLPLAEGVQPEIQQPLRLLLQAGDRADDVLVQALGHEFLLDIRDKAFLVLSAGEFLYDFLLFVHKSCFPCRITKLAFFLERPR